MLAEFLQAAMKAATDNLRPQQIQATGLPRNMLWIHAPDGSEILKETVPVADMDARAADLSTVVEVVRNYGDECAKEIWYCEKQVAGYPSRRDWHDQIILPLTLTPRWKLVAGLAGQVFDQPGIVRLLRIGFGNSLGGDFLDRVRKLIFRQQAKTDGNLSHQKVSIGRSLTAEVDSDVALPETIDLEVPVFLETGYRACVKLAVEINPEAQKFMLTPLPGEIEDGMAAALENVRLTLEALAGEEDVFHIHAGQARP